MASAQPSNELAGFAGEYVADLPLPRGSVEERSTQELNAPPIKANRNWTDSRVGKLVSGTVLAFEGLPITNEASRLAVLGFAIKHGDAATAALLYGASTMAIESSGALVAADAIVK